MHPAYYAQRKHQTTGSIRRLVPKPHLLCGNVRDHRTEFRYPFRTLYISPPSRHLVFCVTTLLSNSALIHSTLFARANSSFAKVAKLSLVFLDPLIVPLASLVLLASWFRRVLVAITNRAGSYSLCPQLLTSCVGCLLFQAASNTHTSSGSPSSVSSQDNLLRVPFLIDFPSYSCGGEFRFDGSISACVTDSASWRVGCTFGL